jgi:hypothetical protein
MKRAMLVACLDLMSVGFSSLVQRDHIIGQWPDQREL